jgi:hypothetical protein
MLTFHLLQATSISKAINSIETPVKQKHVRSILYAMRFSFSEVPIKLKSQMLLLSSVASERTR